MKTWITRASRSAAIGALLIATLAMGAPALARDASGANIDAKTCTPGYSPCIVLKSTDVDCYGGSGNGPRYTRPGVVYQVTGRDRYGLDADNDGKGCER
jgi:hypothetical protein